MLLESILKYRFDGKAAVIDNDVEYSYAMLYNDVAKAQQFLRQREIDTAVFIGDSDYTQLVWQLASTFSGKTYVPLDFDIKTERFNKILSQLKSFEVFNISKFFIQIPEKEYTKLNLDGITAPDFLEIENQSYASQIQYILFTSGSTGIPKGVKVSLENVNSFLKWMTLDVDFSKRVLSQARFSFDMSVLSTLTVLASHGSIILVPQEIISRTNTLFRWLEENEYDVWVSTPSFLKIGTMNERLFKNERGTLFVMGGDRLDKTLVTQILMRNVNNEFVNTYGPTETTVAVTKVRLNNQIIDAFSDVPIGSISESVSFLEVDQSGELIVRGPQVGHGYIGKIGSTYGTDTQGRFYRTGDLVSLASLDQERYIFFQGRKDDQVKINGYRIELQEIEKIAANYPGVSALKTAVAKDRLYLFIVLKPAFQEFNEFAFRNWLSEYVPNYMIPSKVVLLDQLPLNSHDKVDNNALISIALDGEN